MKSKVCTKCGVDKELSEYYKKDKYFYKKCKSCVCVEQKTYRTLNPEHYCNYKKRQKKYKASKKGKENVKKLYEKHKEIIKSSDRYVRARIISNTKLNIKDIPIVLVELKRIQLQITRELRK